MNTVPLALLLALVCQGQDQDPVRRFNERAEEMTKLEFLSGEWHGEGKVFSPGGESDAWTGDSSIRWTLRGRYLCLDSSLTTKNGTSESMTLLTFDRQEHHYRASLFSSNNASTRDVTGQFDGTTLSLVGPAAREGFQLRVAIVKIDDDKYTMEIDLANAERTMRLAQGSYTRKKLDP